MKSNTALRSVDNNSLASTGFTIKASGKMFHMVISGLYSDKPTSITREIWSNAFDAHAMVGKTDVPFEVTFPTALNPTFSCRDFGPGIAHEDMEGFYTVLGHSTKEDTNDAVGKWGVGRMSPMSYTDTFSVVSRHKGKVAYYSVQLGAGGEPELHVLAAPMPTNEPDGLEVSFPVNRNDIFAFQKAADMVAYGFNVPPNITNSKKKTFKAIKKVLEGDNFFLYEDSNLRGAYAQMGCVLYPIPQQYLPRYVSIIYKFDIGALEVTASREALSFGPNDPTAGNIKRKAEAVEGELFDLLQKAVDEQPTDFLAARFCQKVRHFLPYGSQSKLTYRGANIQRYWDIADPDISIHCGYKGYRQNTVGFGRETRLDTEHDYSIFVQDTSSKEGSVRAATRISSELGSYKHYIWVKANLSDSKQKDSVDKLLTKFPYDVTYVKDIPDPGPTVSASKRTVTISVWNYSRQCLEKSSIDDTRFAKGGYYVAMSNNDYPAFIGWVMPFLLSKLQTDVIPFVPKTLWGRFEKASNWKKVEAIAEQLVKKEASNVYLELDRNYNTYPMSKLAVFSNLSGPVGDFAKKVKGQVVKTDYMGVSKGYWQRTFNMVPVPFSFNNSVVVDEYNKLLSRYPLLKALDTSSGVSVNNWCQYVTLIDNADKE